MSRGTLAGRSGMGRGVGCSYVRCSRVCSRRRGGVGCRSIKCIYTIGGIYPMHVTTCEPFILRKEPSSIPATSTLRVHRVGIACAQWTVAFAQRSSCDSVGYSVRMAPSKFSFKVRSIFSCGGIRETKSVGRERWMYTCMYTGMDCES